MNENIKKRWIETLRSDEYEQGYGQLNKDGKFCCLGVLCEIAVADGIVERRLLSSPVGTNSIGYATSDTYTDRVDQDVLPQVVREWADLDTCNPKVTLGDDDRSVLSEANDTHRLSFLQIADIIEDQL